MVSGIYCILNAFSNKRYIGQSFNIKRRINGHKNKLIKNKHENKRLQADFNRNRDHFVFFTLEEINCATSELKSTLHKREVFWIKLYNSFLRGYNQNKGGASIGLSKKRFTWLNIATQESKTCSIFEMAAHTNLTESGFRLVTTGARRSNGGWCLTENLSEAASGWKWGNPKLLSVRNVHTGEVLNNIRAVELAKIAASNRSDVYRLISGKSLQLKGWTLIDTPKGSLNKRFKSSKYSFDALNQVNGRVYLNINLTKFSKEEGIDTKFLSNAIVRKSHQQCGEWLLSNISCSRDKII